MELSRHPRAVTAALALCLLIPAASAQLPLEQNARQEVRLIGADVTVAPKRVVFDGETRSAELVLVNRGAESVTYRIDWTQKRMTEDGELVDPEQPGPEDDAAGAMIRYAPRQIVLAPGERQIVRLFLRKPGGLARGEYRSHLLFRAVPPAEAAADVEQIQDDRGFATRMNLVFGLSLPVIVRHGDLDAEVDLTDIRLETGAAVPAISLSLARSGDRSVFGDLVATLQPAGGGPEVVIGEARGLAVYLPLARRKVRLSLFPPAGAGLQGGTLKLAYQPRFEDDGTIPVRQRERVELIPVP